MRRLVPILALVLIPGAVVVAGVIAAYRYVCEHEDRVSEPTLRRIRADAEKADRARELEEQLVTPPRAVTNGPEPTRALSRVGVR